MARATAIAALLPEVNASAAAAVIARGRDLETDYPATRVAWLAGELSSDAVRELTTGLTKALRRVPAVERDRVRAEAEAILLPLARTATVAVDVWTRPWVSVAGTRLT